MDAEIEVSAIAQPAKKKQRREAPAEDADAKLAAELQAQENLLARSRTTRGSGGGSKVVKKSKAPRKKRTKKVKRDDESDAEGSEDSGTPKRKSGGGFQKPFNLSYALAELCGEPRVSLLAPTRWRQCVVCLLMMICTAVTAAGRQEAMGAH